ncbi:antirestriction protein ArdA [Nodularia sphaerocarpa]|uniref:antirestriction protein ArdA n=1 Tax=Nodularia sphaerocarpa TaxID=137816 RepID=UPI00232E66FC|nr:antirestriction protein ArdA [Nodularia sphaerocarpa]MDB9372377.1 antirestriction protein ArdA [Nodularia sphaerocarpa CS-585]MDB9377993.1 antirestriction protein ArdA [Nodularia sphaerocarpa CS-585A2]
MNLIFQSEAEAALIAEQLYNVEQFHNILFCADNLDQQALELAVALVQAQFPKISVPIVSKLKCPLPFPSHERECTFKDTSKIYVACLSAYNNGHLHGLWIDATQEPEDIYEDIQWMLSWSPMRDDEACEEWAIHDYEDFEDITLGEYESIQRVSALAQALEEATDKEAFAAYLANYQYEINTDTKDDLEEALEKFRDSYCGHYDSRRDFVLTSEEIEAIYNFSGLQKDYQFWSFHIDWESVANELFMTGYDAVDAEPGIYVFRNF